MKRKIIVTLLATLTAACAGQAKACSQFEASAFGSNWIVVQFDQSGQPFNCWKLNNVAVDSSEGGNIGWQDKDGHLVHITGWENRVQVNGDKWESAAKTLGIDLAQCGNGRYPMVK